MSDDEEKNVLDKTVDLQNEFQADPMAGGVAFSGIAGYHTYFIQNGIGNAMTTALHTALDEALMEVSLDARLIEEEYGAVTPRTARQSLEEQLTQFTDIPRGSFFIENLGEEFEQTLEEFESQMQDDDVGGDEQ